MDLCNITKNSTIKLTKSIMDFLYNKYSKFSFIKEDPIQFVHEFKNSKKDQELIAFIVSVMCFGSRYQIIRFIPKILTHLGKSPYQTLYNFDIQKIKELKHLYYRFIKGIDLYIFCYKLHIILNKFNSLEKWFYNAKKKWNDPKDYLYQIVNDFHQISVPKYYKKILSERKSHQHFLLPSPKTSACKRLNLFLKWMIRKDKIDLGLWNNFSTNSLLIPIDTHIARIAKWIKLTKLKTVSWKMAIEITNSLKNFEKNDPVKYDIALFGLGLEFPQLK